MPRVFLISSHEAEDPTNVVARLQMENLYTGAKVLDPRGLFIVQTSYKLWLWLGNDVPSGNLKAYRNAADTHMDLLRKHERASQDTVLVKQGSEGKEFWASFSHD